MKLHGHVSPFRAGHIHFVGQQDGPPEREFKLRLIEIFDSSQSVRAAYLAQVRYGIDGPIEIALCLRLDGADDVDIVANTGSVFAEMFGEDNHLDILVIDATQEDQLSDVCPAFFTRQGAYRKAE